MVHAEKPWNVRLDAITDKALDKLARHWSSSRSEAMRKAVTERAVEEGVLKLPRKWKLDEGA